jgi:Methyltransferase domain
MRFSSSELQHHHPSVAKILNGVEGWCTQHKGSVLYALASQPDIRLGLEIGIFGGKSFFPVCAAFKAKGFGKHYGIEPWSNDIAIEHFTDTGNDDWWAKVDLRAIKELFFKHLISLDLVATAAIIEAPSDAAYRLFATSRFEKKIDLLHIDGSHSVIDALHDVSNWIKLVRPGGYVLLDDINWPSVQLAYEYLKLLGTEEHQAQSVEDGFFSVVRLR